MMRASHKNKYGGIVEEEKYEKIKVAQITGTYI
jgi:hypothetical protein